VHPWDFVVVSGAREAVLHAGVLRALQRVASQLGVEIKLPEGGVGASDAVSLVAAIGLVQDHLEQSAGVAWVAMAASNIALGEWSHGSVDVHEAGVFIDGSRVRAWDAKVAVTELGEVPVPHSLGMFSKEATVKPLGQYVAWSGHIMALSRAIAQAGVQRDVRVQYVASGAVRSTVLRDEESPTP
jgi:hypothetical protein